MLYEYPSMFYEVRPFILKRDEHKCQFCFTRIDLTVHHINECKEDYAFENLVTLCRRCNSKKLPVYFFKLLAKIRSLSLT